MMRFLRNAALALAWFSLAAAHSQTLPVVKFQDIPGLGNVIAKIAATNGYCEKAGIRCELQFIPAASLALQSVLTGSLTAAYTGHEITAISYLRGAKFKSVVGGDMSSFGLIVARNDVPTPNAARGYPAFMADIKGKKVGIGSRGSPSETVVRFMLAKAGIDPESVTYVATGAGDTAMGVLTSGQVDFLSLYEPTAALCRLSGRCKVIWTAAENAEPAELAALNGGGPSTQFTAEFVEKNPAIIKAVIQAFTEAHAFFNNPANTEKIIQIVKSYEKADSRQDDELLRFLIIQAQKRRAFHAHIDRKAVQAVIDYMHGTKLLDQKVPVSELVYEGAPR